MADARWAGDADGLEAVVVDQENLDDFCTPLSPGRHWTCAQEPVAMFVNAKVHVNAQVC